MKVLNLYAGIGGNRKLWEDVEVTAVEMNPDIAELYRHFNPKDTLIVGNAHEYLLKHLHDFDFIWSSPPCPTHSRMNLLSNVQEGKTVKYPEMTLYQEIIYLKHWFKGKWCVENVISYYEPLIRPTESGSHYFWTNFHFTPWSSTGRGILTSKNRNFEKDYREKRLGFDFSGLKINKTLKKKVLNNCVEPEQGLRIFNESKKDIQSELFR